jgi:hypothetical protein
MANTRKNNKFTSTKKEIWKVIPIVDKRVIPDKLKKVIKYKDKNGKVKYIEPNALLIKVRQSGGAGDFPVVNKLIDSSLTFIATRDPTPISSVVNGFFSAVKWPMKVLKGNRFVGPFVEVWMSGLHGTIEGIAAGSAGIAQVIPLPYAAVAAVPIAIVVGATGSIIAVSEGDYGQATTHLLNVVPAIGATITKGMAKVELIMEKIGAVRKRIAAIPEVGPEIVQLVPDFAEESVEPPLESTKMPPNFTEPSKGGKYTRRKRRSNS